MPYYLVRDDRVTVLDAAPSEAVEGDIVLRKAADLDPKRFPAARLVAIWNKLPGLSPIKRFKDRESGVKQLWAEIRKLTPVSQPSADSKQAQIIALLRRPEGAAIEELTEATGWQRHSVRGVLSGVLRKKLGLTVESVKSGNGRVYRIAA